MIKETKNLFEIVTQNNKLKSKITTIFNNLLLEILKLNTIFSLTLKDQNIKHEILGNHFLYNNEERVIKKFKPRERFDLK